MARNPVEVIYSFKIETRSNDDFKTVPIIINNFNRLEYLEEMLNYFQKTGYSNIYIIDNHSTYKPLLHFYKITGVRVFYLNENIGYLSFWETSIKELFEHDYFVYTDPDIVPDPKCPSNFIIIFKEYLDMFPKLDKVGFSLRIDNLPDTFKLKNEVIEHETKFWESTLKEGLFNSPIDTTFALYRPYGKGKASISCAGRTDYPYVARHLPWYVDHKHLSKEEKWYRHRKKVFTHWSNHPSSYGFIKRHYLLIKNDEYQPIWMIRKLVRRFLKKLGIDVKRSNI